MLIAAPVNAAEIAHVWTGWRLGSAFERLSEYFPGLDRSRESPVLVTQPKARDGYYFTVRFENPEPSPGATIELSVISPVSPRARTHTFKADLPAGARTYHLGVTGTDWPGESAAPLAWLVVFRAASGAELARQQSYLWR